MFSSAKVSILETFRSKLKTEWKQRPDCSAHGNHCRFVRHFVRTTLLKEWMAQREDTTCKTNGERLIDEVKPLSWFGTNSKSIFEGDKSCVLVLSCLLHQVHGNEGYSKEGHGKLIYIFQKAGIIDKDLQHAPSSFETLRRNLEFKNISGVEAIIEHFQRKMWAYCPVHLHDGRDMDFGSKLFLPFTTHDRVGAGGTATVFEVRLQQEFVSTNIREHLGNPLEDEKYGACYQFALKSFSDEQFQTYKKESEAFDGLRDEPGMIRSFGCYSCSDFEGVKTYNILLEYGETDLYQSFIDESPPELPVEIVSYWRKICKVAAALSKIHRLSHQGEFYNGWHGDVKPNNILRVKNEWKLADFGFSEFSKIDENIQKLPKIIMRGGTETYGAPECALVRASKSQMKNVGLLYQTIDTWSFGCVLSETATWVVKGETGINDYRKLRELNPEKQKHEDVTDTFHDGSDVLPEIKEWHKVLKTVRRISDSITPKILDLVDEKMLIKNPKARIPSNELYDSLREIISRAEKSERSEPGPAGKESLVMAKSALLSTELARQSTIQSESGRFVKLDHVIDDLHDTQRFPMSPPPSHSRPLPSISQRRESLERDFHGRGSEISMGPGTVPPADKTVYTEQQTPGMADRAKLYQAPRPTRTDSSESLGLSRKPATGHVVGTKGKEVETARGSAKANEAKVGTRYDQDLDSPQQLPAIQGLASSASPQNVRLGQGPVKTSTQYGQPTQPQASRYPPASLGEDKSFQGSSPKKRR